MLSKKIFIPLVVLTFISTMLFVVPVTHAQGSTSNTQGNFFQGFVQFFAQKFGLDKTQVQSAVNDYRTQIRPKITPRPTPSAQDIQNREKSKLDKLVSQNKITAVQEQLILDELSALHSKYNFNNLTPDQRRTKMQEMLNELKTWAQSQRINQGYVLPLIGMRGGLRGGMKRFGKWTPKPSSTPIVTPTP
jgi:hypothetical protein